jgi:hypothetical protein
VRAISSERTRLSSELNSLKAATKRSCDPSTCACATSRIRAIADSPIGSVCSCVMGARMLRVLDASDGSPIAFACAPAAAHEDSRYDSYTSVSLRNASSWMTPNDLMNEASTACGNCSTNLSDPSRGVGTAPARSVSQCVK